LLLLLLLLPDMSRATVHTIPSASFPTITSALAAAAPGDTLQVGPGVFSPSTNGETFPLVIDEPGICLFGSGIGVSILNAEGTASVVRFNAPPGTSGEIRSFTITGGAAVLGGGIRIENGDADVHHNLIIGNSATLRGAAVQANVSAPWIHHNVIWDNHDGNLMDGDDPHGVLLEGVATGIVEHNVIGRTQGNGLLTSGSAAPLVRNNIIMENGVVSPPRGRGICWLSSPSPRIVHNLFYANQRAAVLTGGADHTGAGVNDVSPSDEVYGNLDGDPLLVDPDHGNYTLMAGSPAIDAADPSGPADPDGTLPDIGPYFFDQDPVAVSGAARHHGVVIESVRSPFRGATAIRFTLSRAGRTSIEVLDVTGRRVRPLADAWFAAGPNVVDWDGCDAAGRAAASGVYFVRVRTALASSSAPVLLLR
jgi:hypothetical protein